MQDLAEELGCFGLGVWSCYGLLKRHERKKNILGGDGSRLMMVEEDGMVEIGVITAYHAHVYYEPGMTEEAARRVREGVAEVFPEARLGRWHAVPVGPHTRAMFQIAFGVGLFAGLMPWLMLNREGLSVLVHPETGDDPVDHTAHAAWLGERLALRMEAFG